MMSSCCCVILLTLTLLFLRSSGDDGMKCSSVPYDTTGVTGEIIQSWKFRSSDPKVLRTFSGNYVPRYTEHGFAPKDAPLSTKYAGLDLFRVHQQPDSTAEYLRVKFQREAKVYLFVTGFNAAFPKLALPGWTAEGWAETVVGDITKKAQLGIYKPKEWGPSQYVYVFSKTTENTSIKIPGKIFVIENLTGMVLSGFYWLMVAEVDGSPVLKPSSPPGATVPDIPAGGRCPDELHDLWIAPVRPGETDVGGRTFKTSHPIWDPCYWCAFDHEHGSVPFEAMGYWPRLGYVAYKNNDEPESHNGFKGLMMRVKGHIFYYSVHAQLSQTRRFTARHHTVVIAVVVEATKELVMEMGYKGDFGFAAVRKNPKGLLSVNAQDELIRTELKAMGNQGKRTVNVINPANLNPDHLYKPGTSLLKGRYEIWVLQPLCVNEAKKKKNIVVDFKNAATALKESGSTEVQKLGRATQDHVVYEKFNSIKRDFKTDNIEIGAAFCKYTQPLPADGVFYTDKLGTSLVPKPPPNTASNIALPQFVKPGFSLKIIGRYMAVDTWVGMHIKGFKGRMSDAGRAIIPEEN